MTSTEYNKSPKPRAWQVKKVGDFWVVDQFDASRGCARRFGSYTLESDARETCADLNAPFGPYDLVSENLPWGKGGK